MILSETDSMSQTPAFDKLAAVLFDGDVRVDNFKVTPGTDPNVPRETLCTALYASLERCGLIRNGQLRPIAETGTV